MQPASSSSLISKKKNNNKLKWVLLGLFGILLIIIVSLFFWFIIAVNSPKDTKNTSKVSFEVKSGMGLNEIATELSNKGLIADKNIFILYSRLGPSRGNLKPGVYLFSPSMSLSRIADSIGSGDIASEKVTFLEGTTISQMAKRWEQAKQGSSESFIDASKLQNSYNQNFLQFRANKASLEGYLFPATYDVIYGTSAESQINTMLNTFEKQVIPKLPQTYQNSAKLNDLIILASIVEKEARTTADRRLVAGVFYNRLAKGMKLESDVTINYVTGRTATLAADLKIDSVYNSYLYKGLPPTPICNPSLDAILATANPEKNDYLFFIADKNGVVRYAKNFEEHNQNIQKYLNQ